MAEIHGDVKVLEEARDNIYGLMVALSSAMETDGDDPRPLEVHNGHENLISVFPALSCDVMELETDQPRGGFASYPLRVSVQIRIHTAVDHPGVFVDTIKANRLINSVDNYLKTNAQSYLNANMSDGYARLWLDAQGNEVSSPTEMQVAFPESNTVGGAITFEMQCNYNYTQV